MAQEDYLSGSQFGQVAGGLLARRKKEDKKQFEKALIASAVLETFGQLQAKQKQDTNNAISDIKTNYNDIFVANKEEWDGSRENRQRIEQYEKLGDVYVNAEVEKIVNNTNEFLENDIVWANRGQYSEDDRKKLQQVFDDQKKLFKDELDILREDPRNVHKTFTQYNETAKNEYLAALAQIEDDPTKKGLLRSAFNKIFGYGSASKAELDAALKSAKLKRQEFENDIEASKTLLNLTYESVINNNQEALLKGVSVRSQRRFTFDDVMKQRKHNLDILLDEEGNPNKDFFSLPFNVDVINSKKTIKNLNSMPEKTEENTQKINIKNEKFKNIKTLSKEGDDTIVNSISSDVFQNKLAIQILAMNDARLKNKKEVLVGAEAIHGALKIWSDEGRFVKMSQLDSEGFKIFGKTIPFSTEEIWNADDILFIPPGADFLIRGKATSSDAAHVNAEKGKEIPDLKDDMTFNPKEILDWGQGKEFTLLNSIQRQESIKELKRNYPDEEETIDLIFKPILQNLQMQEKKKVNQTSQDVQMPQMSQDDIDAYIDEQRSKISSRGMEEVKELYNTKQMQFDMERLEKLAQGDSYVRGKAALLKKFNLDINATPEEIEIVLATLQSNNNSLLAQQ